MGQQRGFSACWRCEEVLHSEALEELPIEGLTTPVYLCLSCAGELAEWCEDGPLTTKLLHEWKWFDEVASEALAPLADVPGCPGFMDDFVSPTVEEVAPPKVRVGIAIREKDTGVVLGIVGDESLALGSKVRAELEKLEAKSQEDT